MKDLTLLISNDFLQRLARSQADNHLGMVLIVSQDVIDQLNQNQTAGIDLEDGGFIILVSQSALEVFYKD